MALIDKTAHAIEDVWTYPNADEDAAVRPYRIVPLDDLVTMGPDAALPRPVGVYVAAGAAVDKIVPFLAQLDLIAVEFPKFRDGRGFTAARTLRERYGFQKDIRAVGHILPDQFAALMQCGFSTILTPAAHPPAQWQRPASPSNGGPLLQRLIPGRALGAAGTGR